MDTIAKWFQQTHVSIVSYVGIKLVARWLPVIAFVGFKYPVNIIYLPRVWLEKFTPLLLSVVYTYLRVIEDHAHANLAALR